MNGSGIVDARVISRCKFHNRFDPIYQLLDRIVFQGLFQPPKRSVKGAFEQITAADTDFLLENLNKHRLVLWLNIVFIAYLYLYGLAAILKHGDPAVVVTGLLAPAMITGGAWYAVSFGGIPEKFISSALVLTFCMFLAFTLSMTLLIALLCKLTPWPIGAFCLVPTYAGLYIASILYDNLDGLKIGLDTALLKFSRAALNYYQKHGLVVRTDTELDQFGDAPSSPTSAEIALFNHYINLLEGNIAQLDKERTVEVANHLIAASTDILFKIVNLSLPTKLRVDEGEEFIQYLSNAITMQPHDLDHATIDYLEMAIEALRTVMDNEALSELDSAKADLGGYVTIQEQAKKYGSENEVAQAYQKMADHLFVQVFRKLVSLMYAQRDRLYSGFGRARSRSNE